MIYLSVEEVGFMIKYRRTWINDVLSKAEKNTSTGQCLRADTDRVKAAAVVLYDLAMAMETKLGGDAPPSTFVITPEMKAFMEQAYAVGELTR